MKRFFFFFIACLVMATSISAQTAVEVEQLLTINSVTYEQAAWLLLRAADIPAPSPGEAFRYAAQRKWLPKNVSPDSAARLDGVALLVMRSFGMSGGINYSLFLTPHYAYRELVYQKIIQGRTEPAMKVSGSDLLFIASKVIAQRDEED